MIGGEECNLRFADCPVGNRRVADSFLFSEITTVVDGLPTRTVPFIHRTFSDPVYGPELDAWNTWPSDSIADDGVLNGGDSGSPMYFRMADDTWRLLGVASTNIFSRTLPTWHIYETGKVVNSPYAVTTFAPLPVYLPWIEDVIEAYDPDVDLTPCHTFINVGGVKEYQYLATQDCEDAIAARALDLDANAVAWSDGCDLPAGGDDSSTTGGLVGGNGTDTLVSPLDPCQLALRDVAATGFESWKKTNARADTAVCTTATTYPPLSTDTSAAHKALVATACAKRW